MAQKRVIVVESEKLISAGIYSLLSSNHNLDVFGMSLRGEELFDVADQFQPDVVVMDERYLHQNLKSYLAFIKTCPRLRTIVVNLSTNSLRVCDGQIVHVQHLEDFMDQI
ncbi:MAG: hypothetical protein PVH65_02045 [Chloroflexota bacterium]|jgi:chemotaxis response regulator CheB